MYNYQILYSLTIEDQRAVDAFLDAEGSFNYFQSPIFFNVCLLSPMHTPVYIIAKDGAKVIGVLLYYRQILTSIPLIKFFTSRNIIIGGPVVERNNEEIVFELLNIYNKKGSISMYTQIRNLHSMYKYKIPFKENGFEYYDHLNFIVNLNQTEEILWKNVNTKRRNEIRRAEREGCEVEIQDSYDALSNCYAILKEVYQRAKLPLPHFSHFEALKLYSNNMSGLKVFTAVWEGKIIGCMLCIAYRDTLYDYYAGSYSLYYSKHPNDILPWEVFKWAKKNGFKRFDFGGAGKPDVPYGVREYKKKFGGELVNFGRYEVSKYPKLFKMASLAFQLRQKIKV